MKNPAVPLHGGNIYAAQRIHGGKLEEYLDFSANINPLGVSAQVKHAMAEALEKVTSYPDPEARELRETIAETYKVSESEILIGNGAAELIFQICRVVRPSRVVIPVPTFQEYELAARAEGIPVYKVPMTISGSFAEMPIAVISNELMKGDMLFFCNPNNPTGSIHKREQLIPLLRAAQEKRAWIAVDESFIDFRSAQQSETCRHLVNEYENLIIIHSLTKYLAIPGLRLGFLVTADRVVEALSHGSIPWNVNVVAQFAGIAGLGDLEFRMQSVSTLEAEKDRFAGLLAEIPGFNVFSPSVNFILLDIRNTGMNVAELQEKLWPHRIMIRNCSNFDGLSPSHMRVAVRKKAENDRLVSRLRDIIGKEGV